MLLNCKESSTVGTTTPVVHLGGLGGLYVKLRHPRGRVCSPFKDDARISAFGSFNRGVLVTR